MLTVILGGAEIGMNQPGIGAALRTCFEEIHNAAKRSADLTRQLLGFARKQAISPKVMDLNQTVAGLLMIVERLIGEHIQVVWRPGADLWTIKMDPSQIDQVLTNLCLNARDAIDCRGKVTIETGNVTIDSQSLAASRNLVPTGQYVQLKVTDDGRGMDEEVRAHLFEPFFTTKGVGEGVGLGLATVYGIIQQNNGVILVDGEVGQGMTFTIYLPRFEEGVLGGLAKEQVAPATKGRETLLLVDDEPSVLKMVEVLLKLEGYTVLTAGTPSDAIQFARDYPQDIHLLLTDAVMPEMNGRELSDRLIAIRPQLKRLFMSGYSQEANEAPAQNMYFIGKPFTKQALAAKVRAVLDADGQKSVGAR